MNNINVLISVNEAFLKYTEEMLFSIIYYSSKPINIYMMYQEKEISEEQIEELSKFVLDTGKAQLIPIKFNMEMLEGVRIADDDGYCFSLESYSRLFSAFRIPKEVDKILYLDADIVCTGYISELYDIDFDGKTWVAVEDKGITNKDLERLNLPLGHGYINSGMLLINLDKLRKNYTEDDVLSIIKANHENWIYPDQDFINKVFCDDIKIIEEKFNLLVKGVTFKDLQEKPLIIHYAGSVKPWNDDVSRFDSEFIEPYYEILRLQGEKKRETLELLLSKHKEHGYKNSKI